MSKKIISVKSLKNYFLLTLFCPALIFAEGNIQNSKKTTEKFVVEAGLIATRNMDIHGFNQTNATDGWKKSAASLRLEYWRVNERDWNYGLVYQPLSLKYSDTLKSNLNAKGQVFNSGNPATLSYEFPTIRFTANKPIYYAEDGSYIRLGSSAVVRYAKVIMTSGNQSFTDTNLIAIPVVNFEALKPLGEGYSLFTTADFLPGIGGNALLDGLYDIFLGVRKKLNNGNDLDVGIRLFFGGYDPKKQDDYANRIFFNSVVVRYSF
jgi:hypothetical protein